MTQNYVRKPLLISNPTILSFYESNPHINIETVNLLLIELIQNATPAGGNCDWLSIVSSSPSENECHQTAELIKIQTKLKDIIHSLSKELISQYIEAKTDYIREFRSLSSTEEPNKDLMIENNNDLMRKIECLFSPLAKIKGNGCTIFEKATNIRKQFHKIIHANIDSIHSKYGTETAKTIAKEYIANFENNSSHMIQTIQQLLTDYLANKDTQIETAIQQITSGTMTENSHPYYRIFYEINDVLQEFRKSKTSHPLETLLSQLFSTASISQEDAGYVISRDAHTPIYIEQQTTKDRNINLTEIKSFVKSSQDKSSHGILVSQFTGITSKPNYHIDITNNRILVYIHQMEYSPDKLQIAVDTIDSISEKLSDFYFNAETKYSVPKEVLDDINREYQHFVLQKDSISNTLKDNYKKILAQLDEIKFTSLDKFLSTRYASCKKQGFTCDLCNQFHVGTLKGLAAHKRGCNRKIAKTTSSSIEKIPIYAVKSKLTSET
jgi:vacuolar-type H+-ATPase subunit E/Vma4